MAIHFRLESIERAYASSRSTADKEIERLKRQAEKEENEINPENKPTDDDDYKRAYEDALVGWMEEEESTLSIVRMAFVISIHHFFERHMLGEMNVTKYDQSKVFSYLKGCGFTPQEVELNELRLLANCAKHSEGLSASKLYDLRPDMFDDSKIRAGHKPSQYTLAISDTHVSYFFAAVKKSIPRGRMKL